MADHTAPECASGCRVPHSCCDEFYCLFSEGYARDVYGIELPKTDHPRLQYMGPQGCTVAPHLRPLCTLHVCCINDVGAKVSDMGWTRKYFRIRGKIARLEVLDQC